MTTHASRRRRLAAALAGLTALAAASTVHAATITWGAAQDITGEADVSLDGTLVGAFNTGSPGSGSPVINGVAFAEFAFPPAAPPSVAVGNFTISGGALFGDAGLAPPLPPFSDLTSSYQTMLDSYMVDGVFPDFTLTMAGLTVGERYQFQWWVNISLAVPDVTTATAGNSVALRWNTGLDGGLGQFAIGAFIADNTEQVITFGGPDLGVFNGFQLRQLSQGPVSAVPEPGSALVGILALGLCGARFGRRGRTTAQS